MNAENLQALAAEINQHPEVYDGKTPEEIAALLHYEAPYEEEQPAQLAPLQLIQIMGALQASLPSLLELPALTDMRDKVLAQDREGVGFWAAALALGGKITAEEKAAIDGLLAATVQPPPVVKYHKSRFVTSGLKYRPEFPNKIRPSDVQAALALGGE